MKLNEISAKIEAERKAKEELFAPISVAGIDGVAGVQPEKDELAGLELADLDGVADAVLFLIADLAYRTAGIRTSRLVQGDPRKEIGGLIAYLLDGDAKNTRQRRAWLKVYVQTINRLVNLDKEQGACSGVIAAIADLRTESAEEAAYRLLKGARGNVAAAIESAKAEGREIPKWIFNKALERLTAEIFANMA